MCVDWCRVQNTCEGTLPQRMQCTEPHNIETAQIEFHVQQDYGKASFTKGASTPTDFPGQQHALSVIIPCELNSFTSPSMGRKL